MAAAPGTRVPSFRPSVVPSQQNQRPERVEHENRFAAEHHGAGGRLTHTFGTALGRQAPQATHQRDGCAEAGALDQAEPDVLEPVEELEAFEKLLAREVEKIDG